MSTKLKNLCLMLSYCLLTACALNQSINKPTSEPVGPVFDSPPSAAIGALEKAAAMASNDELAGCLYKTKNGYNYTGPVQSGKTDSFSIQCKIPKGSFVGIYHTHPMGNYSEGISSLDINVANQLHLPSYVFSVSSNRIIVFVPDKTETHCADIKHVCAGDDKISNGDLVKQY